MKSHLLLVVPVLFLSAAVAQAAGCGYCHQPIVGAAYVLKNASHSENFKCTYCAIADASNEPDWKGDVTLIAPSENPKKPVTVKRIGGAWRAFPATAVFTQASPIRHSKCNEQFRAFTSRAAAQASVNRGEADKIISLAQLVSKAS